MASRNDELGLFDMVVNALWEGKLAIDETVRLTPLRSFSHRYHRTLFIRTSVPQVIPSVLIATGPIGDIKTSATGISTSPSTAAGWPLTVQK